MSKLTPNEYQKKCLDTAMYPDMGKNPAYPALGLGEAGEVQNVVKKIYRDCGGQIREEHREAVKKELGDLLWYVAVLGFEFDLTLEDIMETNLAKLADRKERGVITGSGDNR